MKNDKALNRIHGLIDQGKDKMHDLTDDLEERLRDEAEAMARRARAGLKQGREQLQTAEEVVMRNVQDHPVIFILGALSIVGLFLAVSRLLSEPHRHD